MLPELIGNGVSGNVSLDERDETVFTLTAVGFTFRPIRSRFHMSRAIHVFFASLFLAALIAAALPALLSPSDNNASGRI